jgi:hypothetical protein
LIGTAIVWFLFGSIKTFSESGPQRAVLELRYIAARYGPPEIRALAKPAQLPGDPRGPQF